MVKGPLAHGELIGRFRNTWRLRDVFIYAHPTDPTRVITCGIPMQGDTTALRHASAPEIRPLFAEHVWTDEPRELFATYIGTFHKVYR